ncbi:hypothetical protein ABZX40_13400 [Streptomyces sp. NPDC004610]|uniref:hypothetical protein n=1 Tax=unclassified Streptomyces TaxID=2593676 RepID=UPI0033A87ECA
MGTPDTDAPKPRPDYPPKTPPPPKRPLSPPRPERGQESALPEPQRAARSGRPVMKDRAGANWTLDAQPWAVRSAPGKAVAAVTEQLGKWGLPVPADLDALVRHLITTVLGDGGRRVSLHAAEQDHQVLMLALSHQPNPPALDGEVLPRLRELGAVSCGTEAAVEGRQVWAVLDLDPRTEPVVSGGR